MRRTPWSNTSRRCERPVNSTPHDARIQLGGQNAVEPGQGGEVRAGVAPENPAVAVEKYHRRIRLDVQGGLKRARSAVLLAQEQGVVDFQLRAGLFDQSRVVGDRALLISDADNPDSLGVVLVLQ